MAKIKHKIFIVKETAIIEVFNKNYDRYFYVLIDKEDLEKVEKNAVNLSVGVNTSTNYCCFFSKKDGKTKSLHRFLMDTPKGMVVDHINHDGLDNRKSNLKNCTSKENNLNRVKGKVNPLFGTFDKYGNPALG